ncbi:MAG: hypothetical protein K6G24_09685 [Lachnospiraceae bacterium]|nr:hypothetical protein [Lachnospiraceae bacterium]
MKNYESPVIFDNEELAEGIYATGSGGAGGNCYIVKSYEHQGEHQGQNDYRFQVSADHVADHVTNGQTLVISFDHVVTYKSCNGHEATLVGSDTGTTLHVHFGYLNHPTSSIGIGDFIVTCSEPNVSDVYCTGCYFECDYVKGIR